MKQETLEEAAEQFEYTDGIYGFKQGTKWQAKRMYSEEEVYNLLCKMPNYFNMTIPQQTQARKEWFEQFKKKLNN